jgi:aspartate oxidase
MAFASSVDFIVMGAGVAGLRAALELADEGDVLVVTKESLGESNTFYAQGGIAVASWEDTEDIALHLNDTVSAGDGLVFRPAAEVLVAEGPERVAELIKWGTRFDRDAASCCARAKVLIRGHGFCMPMGMRPEQRLAGHLWPRPMPILGSNLLSGQW